MAIIQIKVDNADEFYEYYETRKKWVITDKPCKLWDTVILVNEKLPRWRDFPIYRTITHIATLVSGETIISLK